MSEEERRQGPSDRRIPLPECAIEWAEHQINTLHRSRRDVAEQLGINRRNLDRRLERRRLTDRPSEGLLVRCQRCGALTREEACPNGHPVVLRVASR